MAQEGSAGLLPLPSLLLKGTMIIHISEKRMKRIKEQCNFKLSRFESTAARLRMEDLYQPDDVLYHELENPYGICPVCSRPVVCIEVDTPADLEQFKAFMAHHGINVI